MFRGNGLPVSLYYQDQSDGHNLLKNLLRNLETISRLIRDLIEGDLYQYLLDLAGDS
jgi:hypothetical protein